MIAFTCTHCGRNLKVKDELTGKKVKCPGCGKPTAVPELAVSPSPDPGGKTGVPSVENERTMPPANVASEASEENTLSRSVAGEHTDAGAPRADSTQPGPNDAHDSELTDFLAPPESADEIGRLGGFRIL